MYEVAQPRLTEMTDLPIAGIDTQLRSDSHNLWLMGLLKKLWHDGHCPSGTDFALRLLDAAMSS